MKQTLRAILVPLSLLLLQIALVIGAPTHNWIVLGDTLSLVPLFFLSRKGVISNLFPMGMLSVCLILLAEPANGYWPAVWFGLIPCFVILSQCQGVLSAFLQGWWIGTLIALGIFSWLWGALHTFFERGVPWTLMVLFLITILLGIQFALFIGLTRFLGRRFPYLPMGPLGAMVYTLCEFWMPLPFPIDLALALSWSPILIQLADLVGMAGISLLIAWVSGTVYQAIVSWQSADNRRCVVWMVAALLTVGGQVTYGSYCVQTYAPDSSTSSIDVAMIQPVSPLKVMNSDHETKQRVAEKLIGLSTEAVESSTPDLLVWPEGAAPFSYTTPSFNPEYLNELKQFHRKYPIPLLIQDIEFTRLPDSTRIRYYSTATLVDSSGAVQGRYRKNILLPFAEYLPGENLIPGLKTLFNQTRSILGGDTQQLLEGPEGPFAALICYEILFSDFVREFCQPDARYMVNMTNDRWYGADQQPWQHLGFAVYRAVENRLPVIRCTNSGISAFVDANGRIGEDRMANPHEETFLRGKVFPRAGGSFYSRNGDVLHRFLLTPALFLMIVYTLMKPAVRRMENDPPVENA